MARTRVRWGRVAVLVTVLACGLGAATTAAAAGSPSAADRPAVRTYVVRAGDTLWGIAERRTGQEGDPRPVVDAIVAANGLRSAIVPGQTIVIPAA